MKYCPFCGRKIEDTARICPHCNSDLDEPELDENVQDDTPEVDDEPIGVMDRIKAAAGGFFGDGPENRSFIVVGIALLAAVVIAGTVLAHGLFSKKTGTTGTNEVASNTGVTTSSTGEETGSDNGAKTGADSSSKTGKDNTDDVIDTTPTDEMKKRQEEAEKRKAEKEAAEKAEREAAEKKAAQEKAAVEKKKAEEAKKAEEQKKSEQAKEEAAKERQAEAAKKKAEEEAKKKAEEEAKKKAEEEAKKKAEEAKKKAEEGGSGQGTDDSGKSEEQAPAQPGSNTPATAEEAFKALYQSKKFLYGQQYTCYLTDPAAAQESQAQGQAQDQAQAQTEGQPQNQTQDQDQAEDQAQGQPQAQPQAQPIGLDITAIPEGEMAYYVYDFDEDGAVELLTLVLSQERTILATMYEFDGDEAMAANQIEVEMPANADGIKRSLPIVGGVPAFANAFVYKVDDSVRIGFEFAGVAVHASGAQLDIVSYVYEGDVFELRDSFTLAGSTIEMDVVSDVKYYKELREKFAKLGAGDMSQEDIAAMWSMKTHFSDHLEDVREIFRAENKLTASGFDYSKWMSDGKKRTEYSKTGFTAQADLFKGKGAKYKAPGTVPIPEESAGGSQQKQDESGQQSQDENGQQSQNESGQQSQNENGQQNQDTDNDGNDNNDWQDNVVPEEPDEETLDTSDRETGDAANPEEPANNSDSIDLSFLDGVWEKVGGRMEGVEQPTMVFDGYTVHCHSAENGDYDVAIAEIIETDYGYFLRMDSGTWQFGYRWKRETPNQIERVDTWDTEGLSTYSYVRVE